VTTLSNLLRMRTPRAGDYPRRQPLLYAESFSPEPLRRSLGVIREVGLAYIRLGQSATELSGGEAQRVKLATELQRSQRGETLYVLDEPTTGMHPSDVAKLMKQLDGLVEAGNTVIVVEHDMSVAAASEWIIDIGPGAGDEGGRIVASGAPAQTYLRSGEFRKALGLGVCSTDAHSIQRLSVRSPYITRVLIKTAKAATISRQADTFFNVCHLGRWHLEHKTWAGFIAAPHSVQLVAPVSIMCSWTAWCGLILYEGELFQISGVSTFTKATHLMDGHASGSPARRRSAL
jgi:hypothetical protein